MSVPLSEYVLNNQIIMMIELPGFQYPHRIALTEVAQQLMRRLLKLMPDPVKKRGFFSELNAESFSVNQLNGQPSVDAVFHAEGGYDANQARMNYASVETIFRETIFSGKVTFLPRDFQQLLELMKNQGHTASYLIQHHCSLVWAIDKRELFVRIYDDTDKILRKQNYMSYQEVMDNLVFPLEWYKLVQVNQHLKVFYKKGRYNQVGSHLGKEVLRFKRNTYSHCLDHAWGEGKKRFDQAMVGEMLKAVLPQVLHNFQVELDKRGLLRDIKLESLFQ